MYRDTTYKEKFAILKDWAPSILDEVKKDLRNDHIRQDYVFAKKYMKGKNPSKITLEDMVEGYLAAIAEEEKGEEIAEFIANRWMLQSGDLYGFFEKELQRINPEFTEIKEIPEAEAKDIINRSVAQFGAPNTYLFAVINSVAFSKDHFDKLKTKATEQRAHEKEEGAKLKEAKDFESLKREFELKLSRQEEKYEKKLEGLQKKYVVDTEALKKQVSALQKKLHANA
jgi:hypothetical protein